MRASVSSDPSLSSAPGRGAGRGAVPGAGVEPARPFGQAILSRPRLPVPPPGRAGKHARHRLDALTPWIGRRSPSRTRRLPRRRARAVGVLVVSGHPTLESLRRFAARSSHLVHAPQAVRRGQLRQACRRAPRAWPRGLLHRRLGCTRASLAVQRVASNAGGLFAWRAFFLERRALSEVVSAIRRVCVDLPVVVMERLARAGSGTTGRSRLAAVRRNASPARCSNDPDGPTIVAPSAETPQAEPKSAPGG